METRHVFDETGARHTLPADTKTWAKPLGSGEPHEEMIPLRFRSREADPFYVREPSHLLRKKLIVRD